MKKIVVIGATGHVGQATIKALLEQTDSEILAISRHAKERLNAQDRLKVENADATKLDEVLPLLQNQDAVFIAVSGEIAKIGATVLAAAKQAKISKIVFIASMGIYDEIPSNIPYDNLAESPILIPFRQVADEIEESGLDYTIIRPGWFENGPVNYGITQKGEAFGGLKVSISSIGDAAKKALVDGKFKNQSIGIHTPKKGK